jgi:hypothetical protein
VTQGITKDRPAGAIYAELIAVLTGLSSSCGVRGLEQDIVSAFLRDREVFSGSLPYSDSDTVVTEMAFRYGRADVVIFHVDGSATVIEAKDGKRGYGHVMSGLGQVGLYATQLALTRTLKSVRRCLLWGSTGDLRLDATISAACDNADVAWIVMPPSDAMAGMSLLFNEADGQAT